MTDSKTQDKPLGPNDPPRATGNVREMHSSDLTGLIFPWKDGQPLTLGVSGSQSLYLPVFHEEQQLRTMMKHAQVEFDSIKLIQDGSEFLSGIPNDIKVAVDFRLTPEGRVRWTEIAKH